MPRISPTKAEFDALDALNTITELGNGWYSQPLQDGRVHVWKEYEALNKNSSAWGSIQEIQITGLNDWPFGFTATPEHWANVLYSQHPVMSVEYSGSTATKHCAVYLTSPVARTGWSASIVIHAIGTPAAS